MSVDKTTKAVYVVCALAGSAVLLAVAVCAWAFVSWLETTVIGKTLLSFVIGSCYVWIAVMLYRSWIEDIDAHDA